MNRRMTWLPKLIVWLYFIGLSVTAAFAPCDSVLVRMDPQLVATKRSSVDMKRGENYGRIDGKRFQLPMSGPNHRNSDHSTGDPNETRTAVLVLFTVPMAWGTFEPAVRYVYDIQPDVPPFVFQFVYYLIAAISLAVVSVVSKVGATFGVSAVESSGVSSNPTKTVLPTMDVSLQGGFELGTYLFLGNAMQVVGLKTIASDRAAFLLQLTTIFVPLVQSIVARDLSVLPSRTWLSCFMALAGVAFIGFDDTTVEAITIPSPLTASMTFSQGDVYIILAALFYTFHCLRLETYAKGTPALQLAMAKASTEMIWCGMVVLVSILVALYSGNIVHNSSWDMLASSGKNILQYTESFEKSLQNHSISSDEWLKLGLATLWIGVVTVGYTISAQSFGQARIPPATANLIYSIQPLFTALIAFFVLGESLGPAGYAGGILVGAAVLLVIQGND